MEQTPTNEIQQEETQVVVLKIDQINAFNTTQAFIDELKADYSALVIAGIEDKSGYKVAKEGKAKCVSARNKIDKRRKSLKSDLDKVGKSLLDDIAKAENNLDKQLKKIDDAVAKAKQDEKLAAEKQFTDRTDKLFALGTGYNGAVYSLGTTYITPQELQTMSDEFFTTTLAKFEDSAKVIADKVAADLAASVALDQKAEELKKKEAEIDAKLAKLALLENSVIEQVPAITPNETDPTATVNIDGKNVKHVLVGGVNNILTPGENKAADMLENMKPLEKIINVTSPAGETTQLQVNSVSHDQKTNFTTLKTSSTRVDNSNILEVPIAELPSVGMPDELKKDLTEQIQGIYNDGFKKCQSILLMFVSDPSKQLTRAVLIEKISKLEPEIPSHLKPETNGKN